jgi:hypothetical protein
MFRTYTKIYRDAVDGKDVIIWDYVAEGVNIDRVTALVTPSGLMMLESFSTVKKGRAAGVMLDMARWWRRNKPTD